MHWSSGWPSPVQCCLRTVTMRRIARHWKHCKATTVEKCSGPRRAVCQPQCRSITCLNYLPWHSINKGFPSAAVIYLYWSSIKHLIPKLQIGLLQGVPNNNRPLHGYALWILVSSHGWTGGQDEGDPRDLFCCLLPVDFYHPGCHHHHWSRWWEDFPGWPQKLPHILSNAVHSLYNQVSTFLYFHISAGNLYSVTIFLFSNAILLMQWQGNGYKVIWLLGVTNLCNKESWTQFEERPIY